MTRVFYFHSFASPFMLQFRFFISKFHHFFNPGNKVILVMGMIFFLEFQALPHFSHMMLCLENRRIPFETRPLCGRCVYFYCYLLARTACPVCFQLHFSADSLRRFVRHFRQFLNSPNSHCCSIIQNQTNPILQKFTAHTKLHRCTSLAQEPLPSGAVALRVTRVAPEPFDPNAPPGCRGPGPLLPEPCADCFMIPLSFSSPNLQRLW